jgi:hypothetical protein
MFAWAKGCVAEYVQAEALWDDLLAMARETARHKDKHQDIMEIMLHAAEALVDCFAAAEEMARARHVAQTAWESCLNLDATPIQYRDQRHKREEATWLKVFHQADLPHDEIGRTLLTRLDTASSLEDQGVAFSLQAWMLDMDVNMSEWFAWIQACIEQKEFKLLQHFHGPVTGPLRRRKLPDELIQFGEQTWEFLGTFSGKQIESVRYPWNWTRFNVWSYLEVGDMVKAEALTYQAIAELDYDVYAAFLIDFAARRGEATPPELVRIAEEKGIEAIDSYGKWGQYFIAREAAAAGNTEQAFAALRRALNYWSNPPYYVDEIWENDAYWGDLREHPEYKRIYAQKRQRIGPIHGILWYFPGW